MLTNALGADSKRFLQIRGGWLKPAILPIRTTSRIHREAFLKDFRICNPLRQVRLIASLKSM